MRFTPGHFLGMLEWRIYSSQGFDIRNGLGTKLQAPVVYVGKYHNQQALRSGLSPI